MTERLYRFHDLHIGGKWQWIAEDAIRARYRRESIRKAANTYGKRMGRKFKTSLNAEVITVRRIV